MPYIACQIDSREPLPFQTLRFGAADVSVATLAAGDFLGLTTDGTIILAERKSASDLLGSIADRRLFDQARRMREAAPWCYLVVTGELRQGANGKTVANGRPTEWDWSSVQGALLCVQELGVCTVYCDESYYAATLVQLADRPRGPVRLAPRRTAEVLTPAEVILTGFPGVGDAHARALLEYCGNAAHAIQYLTGDYMLSGGYARVPGVGPVTRQRAREALGLGPEYELVVALTDEAQKQLVERAYAEPVSATPAAERRR